MRTLLGLKRITRRGVKWPDGIMLIVAVPSIASHEYNIEVLSIRTRPDLVLF